MNEIHFQCKRLPKENCVGLWFFVSLSKMQETVNSCCEWLGPRAQTLETIHSQLFSVLSLSSPIHYHYPYTATINYLLFCSILLLPQRFRVCFGF